MVNPETPARIAELRALGLPWKQIGLQLELNPETCRRTFWVERKAGRAALKSRPPSEISGGEA